MIALHQSSSSKMLCRLPALPAFPDGPFGAVADFLAAALGAVLATVFASYQKEAPRLCRGGSRSLTFQEVVHRRDFQS